MKMDIDTKTNYFKNIWNFEMVTFFMMTDCHVHSQTQEAEYVNTEDYP